MPDDRRRFVGQADVPLTDLGLDQARRLAERLRDIDFDAAYSSDLRRCVTTTALITEAAGLPLLAESGLRFRTDRRLREIDAGAWEMLSFETVARMFPAEHARRERDLVRYRFPGGESFVQLQQRAVAAFHDIVARGGSNILVVAHRGVNRVLLCHLLGRPLEDLFSVSQGYGCVNLIKVGVRGGGGTAGDSLTAEVTTWES
ncbi:MAG: histidine phosphatase family protein [Thermoleophilia bacterium]|nr:histidine phosphatase family protein [Thermoleophilia bacterium]